MIKVHILVYSFSDGNPAGGWNRFQIIEEVGNLHSEEPSHENAL